MANEKVWSEVGNQYPKGHDFKQEKEVVGVYKELKTFVDKDTERERKAYILDTKDGERTIYGSGLLDYLMNQVKVGEEIKIEYLGKKQVTIDGKRRQVNQYKVYRSQ